MYVGRTTDGEGQGHKLLRSEHQKFWSLHPDNVENTSRRIEKCLNVF